LFEVVAEWDECVIDCVIPVCPSIVELVGKVIVEGVVLVFEVRG
jgi:hypothetical protein